MTDVLRTRRGDWARRRGVRRLVCWAALWAVLFAPAGALGQGRAVDPEPKQDAGNPPADSSDASEETGEPRGESDEPTPQRRPAAWRVDVIPPEQRGPTPADEANLFGDAAGEPVDIDDETMALVSRLDHPDFHARQQATEALIDSRPTLAMLRTLLSAEFLSTEQRNRLLLVTQRKLLQTPRGALGIRMQQLRVNMPRPGLHRAEEMGGGGRNAVIQEVVDLLPDLPAREVLKVGDRITHVDGELLTRRAQLVNHVQERRPGEEVVLTVQRVMRDETGRALRHEDGSLRYKQMEVSVTLGSADKLIDPRTGQVNTNSDVYRNRKLEADRLADRFAVTPQRLVMAEPAKRTERVAVVMTSDTSGGTGDSIEEHKFIKELRRDLRFIRRGDMAAEHRIPVWQSHLAELDEQIQNLKLPREQRNHLNRVRQRFMAIIANANVLD